MLQFSCDCQTLINIAFLQTKTIDVTKICSHCPAVLDKTKLSNDRDYNELWSTGVYYGHIL